MQKLRVIIAQPGAAETPPLRQQLERLGHSVVEEASDVHTTLCLIRENDPDVALVVDGLPGTGGSDAIAMISTLSQELPLPVILLTTHDNPALVEQAHATGAGAYLVLPTSDGELNWALTAAVRQFRDQEALRQLRAQAAKDMDQWGEASGDQSPGVGASERQQVEQMLNSLNAAALAVQQTLDPQEIFQVTARELGNLGFGCTGLLSDERRENLEVVFTNVSSQTITAVEKLVGAKAIGYRIPIERVKVFRTAFHERQATLVLESKQAIKQALPKNLSRLARQVTHLIGLSRFISAPLVAGDTFLGVLVVHSPTLNELHVPAVTAFANQVAVAVENARLFAGERAQTQRQAALSQLSAEFAATFDEDQICRRVITGLHDTLGYDYLALFLVDEAIGERVLAASIGWSDIPADWRLPPGQGLSERPLLDGQLHYTPDTASDPRYIPGLNGSEIDVPLRLGEKILGVLVVESQQTDAFGQGDFKVLTTAANQAAVAIGKARLLTAERQRADELEALRATITDISAELELPRLLQAILERAVVLLDATGGDLGLFDESSQEIEIVVSHNMGKDYTGTRQVIGEGAMGHVAQTREPVIIGDYVNWQHRSPQYAEGPWHAVLAAPLLIRDRLVGAIGIVDADPIRQFTASDLHLLSSFAQQAAIAVENARLFQAEREQRELSETLRQVTNALSASLDQEQVLRLILEQLARVVDYDGASVMLVSGDVLVTVAQQGFRFERQSLDPVQIKDLPHAQEVLEHHRPLIIANTSADARWYHRVESQYIRCWLGVPLMVQDRVIGLLNLDREQSGSFTAEEAGVAVAFANHAANAIANARLFKETQAAFTKSEALYRTGRSLIAVKGLSDTLQTVVDAVAEALPANRVVIWTLDLEKRQVIHCAEGGPDPIPFAHVPFDELWDGLCGWALREQKPALSPKGAPDPRESPSVQERRAELGVGSVIAVPLRYRDKTLGAMVATNHLDQRDFTPQDVELLMAIANQAVIAIENTQLYETQRQQADELARLHRASATLLFSATADLPTLAQNIVEAVLREFGQANCSLLLLNPTTSELERIGVAGPYISQVIRGRLTLSGPGLVPRAVRTGQIVNVPDVSAAPDYVANWDQARSEMAVPLRVGDQVIGALDVQSSQPATFGPIDERLLSSFAERAALALENARLYQETVRRADEMSSLYQIGLATVSSLSLDDVLAAIYEQCRAVLPCESFYVALHRPGERYIHFPLFINNNTPIETDPLNFEAGEGFISYVIRQRRPLVLDARSAYKNHQPVRPVPTMDNPPDTYLGVPLILRGDVMGVLSVQSSNPQAYSEDHVRLLSTIAAQAAIAIENARLYQESQRRQAEAVALYEATRPIPSLDLTSVLETMARRASVLTDLPYCAISLLKPAGTEAAVVTVWGLPEQRAQELLNGMFGPLDHPPSWQRVFVEHQPYVVASTKTAPLRMWGEEAASLHKSILIVPLMVGDRLIGSLQLAGEARALPDELVRRVETFAAQAAITIENARLHKAVQEYASSLQIASWEKEQLLEQLQRHAETLEQQVAARTAQIFAEKEKVEAILKSAGDAIMITTPESRISYVNDAFTNLTGYVAQDVVDQRTIEGLFADQTPPTTITDLKRAMAQGVPWRGDVRVGHRDGHTIEADMTLAPVRDEREQVIGLVSSLRDVAQARALERAKSEFLTNVSHQLRTPVTNLKAFAFLLSKGPPDNQARYIQTILDEVEKLSHLIQDLLQIAELDAGPAVADWVPVSLVEIISLTLTRYQSQAAAAGLVLKTEIPDQKLPPVLGSKIRLAQALNQIVENALAFTVEGEIVIGIRLDLSQESGASEVVVWVSDTGPGISPYEQTQIFDRFFRGEAAQPGHILGTGLGLSIARMIIEAHGGRIEVHSAIERGSTFELWLPALG